MKTFFPFLLFLVIGTCLYAQTTPEIAKTPPRRIRLRTIGKDSINISFNDSYDMIEDSCADITRYAHINMSTHKFFGPFKDLSTLDSSVVIAEGNYSADGLKTGLFISHYINGSLRSKGYFKNDRLDGRWETFYDNDKPAMVFEVNNNVVKIADVWDKDGKKVVEGGKGPYQVMLGRYSWKGKLEGGIPDGNWIAFNSDDASQAEISTESFKKGIFKKGTSPIGNYSDTSRIVLLNTDAIPYVHAERLHTSVIPCNGVKRKHIVRAQYARGRIEYSELMKMAIRNAMRNFNIRAYGGDLVFTGQVSQFGTLDGFTITNALNLEVDTHLTRRITDAIETLPMLQPATINGKPVTEKFVLTITFELGRYRFNYKFLPVDRNL